MREETRPGKVIQLPPKSPAPDTSALDAIRDRVRAWQGEREASEREAQRRRAALYVVK